MQFQPKTEEQIAAENLLEAGIYDFEIIRAEEKVSKSGNQMIALGVRVFTNDGKSTIVDDYLLESLAYKLRHCADACKLLDKYEAGSIQDVDLVGKTGKLSLIIQKDKEGKYPDKNAVKDYVKRESPLYGNLATQPSPTTKTIDDEIPF